jgi:hypothetical protein
LGRGWGREERVFVAYSGHVSWFCSGNSFPTH